MEKLSAREIILKNISQAQNALAKKRLIYDAQIKELAYLLTDRACEDGYSDFEAVSDRLRGEYAEFLEGVRESAGAQTLEDLDGIDFRLRFCDFVSRELISRGVDGPSFDRFEDEFRDGIRVACFSNRAADEAYARLNERLGGASRVIGESIVALCEEVADGRCELCLLPIYSSLDGLMLNIYRQTRRYGLSPVMSVDVPSDGDLFVRYFLFASGVYKRDGAETVMLTVVPDEERRIEFLPAALAAYGATVEDMTSLSPSLYDGNRAFQFTFSTENADIMRIYLFLQINFPRFEINGIYEKAEAGV